MGQLEQFAGTLLGGPPEAVLVGRGLVQEQWPPALSVWIAYLYGYSYAGVGQVVDPHSPFVLTFRRDDDPEARRRAAWMRDPSADPALPPPVGWRLGGGDGFCPPGWHPDVRLIVPPDQQIALAAEARRLAHDAGMSLVRTRFDPVAAPPRQVHPPGAPPSGIAYPD